MNIPQHLIGKCYLPKNPEDMRIKRVIAVIERLPTCEISQLAKSVRLSSSRLTHLFKQQTGLSLSQYLHSCRLRHAAYLLSKTDEAIKSIGFAIGYSHNSSFVRAFIAAYREGPSVYRRRKQGNSYFDTHSTQAPKNAIDARNNRPE